MKKGIRPGLLLAAVLLTSVNLRVALASVSPLYDEIQSDLGIGRAAAGLVVTLPVLCMALFAPLATLAGRSLGRRRTILASMVLIGVATLLRFEGGVFVLFASALAAGVGIATIQALVPEVIKRNFASNSATVTGAYTASMALGATLAASTVVPLSSLTGSWPFALSLWGLIALPAVVAWLPLREDEGESHQERRGSRRLPLAAPRVWLVVAVFSVTSLMYYALLSWLAPLFEDAGLSSASGGLLLSTFTGVQIATAFIVPALTNRFPDRRPALLSVIALSCAGLLLVALVPAAQPWMPWTWSALLGFSQGALFPLALTLPLDNTSTPEMSGKLSSLCFLVGYTTAAVGPTLIGAARDATGGFAAPFTVLSVFAFAQFLLATRLAPGVDVEDRTG